MSSHEPLPRAYEPAAVEAKWFPTWEKAGNFHGEPDPDKKPYSIVIPPPVRRRAAKVRDCSSL